MNLTIQHGCCEYAGLLPTEPDMRNKIYKILEQPKGRSIQDVGEIEIEG
jgi:hypothetical protein